MKVLYCYYLSSYWLIYFTVCVKRYSDFFSTYENSFIVKHTYTNMMK